MSVRSLSTFCALAVIAAGLSACGEEESREPTTYVICIDSSLSTEGQRDNYLPTLETVADEAASEGAHLYADACGANATGTVRWTIDEDLKMADEYSGPLADSVAAAKAKKLVPEFQRLVAITSEHGGTPLGEMLALASRRCAASPGACKVFILSDGEWADRGLRVNDGVSATEESRYVSEYDSRLGGLSDASVSFFGVGFGTHLGEARLGEARKVAASLVDAGEAILVAWNVSP